MQLAKAGKLKEVTDLFDLYTGDILRTTLMGDDQAVFKQRLLCPETVGAAFAYEKKMPFKPLQGEWRQKEESYLCLSPYGYGCALLGSIPEVCRLEMKVRFTERPVQFGVAAEVDETFSEGYYFSFQPGLVPARGVEEPDSYV